LIVIASLYFEKHVYNLLYALKTIELFQKGQSFEKKYFFFDLYQKRDQAATNKNSTVTGLFEFNNRNYPHNFFENH